MKRTGASTLDPFRGRLSKMFALRPHAERTREVSEYRPLTPSSTRSKSARKHQKLKRRWTLSLHPVEFSQHDFLIDATKHSGWVHFLDGGNGHLGITDIHKGTKRPALASFSTGHSTDAQHRILERFLKSQTFYRGLKYIVVPGLHLRALSYVDVATGKPIVIPLFSAVLPLRLGRRYSANTIQMKLKAALDYRHQRAKESREREERLSKQSAVLPARSDE